MHDVPFFAAKERDERLWQTGCRNSGPVCFYQPTTLRKLDLVQANEIPSGHAVICSLHGWKRNIFRFDDDTQELGDIKEIEYWLGLVCHLWM